MIRRYCLGLLLLASLSALADQRPNIVLVLVDDLGFSDLGSYGSDIDTPTIDALAAEGVRFSNYHTSASCAPSRAMLLTGVDSHRNGVPNIPEALPPEQREHAHYAGVLGDNVVTIATLLRDAGYHTTMAGKWHLGMAPDKLPPARGFDRSVSMADTGSDNFEQKPYLPIYKRANWFEDDKRLQLPEDFYSSEYLIDRSIEFIDAGLAEGKPFFAYVPFLAVHIPVQAPQKYIDKYMGQYDDGWDALRERRYRKAVELGLVPEGIPLRRMHTTDDWNALSEEDRRYRAKAMAVYAGMIDAMDEHLGRLVEYLKARGEYDNTIFIVTSDNGAEASDPVATMSPAMVNVAMRAMDYSVDYDTLGTKGSFTVIGDSFASAAASPFAWYKFYSGEGGLRVPLIISGPAVTERGTINHGLSWVTDVAATVMAMAGVSPPAGEYAGKAVEPVTGRNLLPVLTGRTMTVRGPDDAVGYEVAGNAALFKGRYKITLNRPPAGDGEWHLYDLQADPGETRDLKDEQPARFEALLAEYEQWAEANQVLPVPEGYDQSRQLSANGMRKRIGGPLAGLALAILSIVFFRRLWRQQVISTS